MTGDDLTRARKERHFSLLELSSRTGLSLADLAALEVNEPQRLSHATTLANALRRYAAAVGLDTAALLREYAPSGVRIMESSETDSLDEFPSEGGETSSAVVELSLDGSPQPVLQLSEPVPQLAEPIPQFSDSARQTREPAARSSEPPEPQELFSRSAAAPAAEETPLWRRPYVLAASLAAIVLSASLPFLVVRVARQKLASPSPSTTFSVPPSVPDKPAEPQAGDTTPVATHPRTAATVGSRGPAPQLETTQATDGNDELLNGWWDMTNRIDTSSYARYQGMRLGYRVEFRQEGGRVTGRGQKWTENGHDIPRASRTVIEVEGTLENGRLALTFTEYGARRTSLGTLALAVTDAGQLTGTFESDAARSRGSSVARRIGAASPGL